MASLEAKVMILRLQIFIRLEQESCSYNAELSFEGNQD